MNQMKKRIGCLLMAAVMALLFLPSPARACDHCDEDGEPLKYKRSGYVAPQIGVPGYSGDLCCPKCGAVVIPGAVLPALEEPAGPSAGTEPRKQPEKTAKPETPARTERPVQTEKPAKPETPARTATPAPTKAPAKQTPKTQPETPAVVQTKRPSGTRKPDQPKTTAKPDGAGGKKTEGEKTRRERFSRNYPFRRVRMQPEEGVYAEAAGILVWPAAASPFQSMLD